MIRDAANSFVYGDVELAKNVIERDDESNRLYFLLVRILRTIIQNPRLTRNSELPRLNAWITAWLQA